LHIPENINIYSLGNLDRKLLGIIKFLL